MNNVIQTIPLHNLAIAFVPVLVALVVLIKWSLNLRNAPDVVSRMLIQLLLIGNFFEHD